MENRLKRKLAANALTFCLGVNQARTPNIVMIAAAVGFDANPTSLETCSMLCVTAIAAVERAGRAARSRGLFEHDLQTEIVRLGARYLTAGNDVQYLLRAAKADIDRMRTIPVP